MAVDEAILDRYADGSAAIAGPTVRLYAWSPATLSLGRRQAPSHDAAFLAAQGLGLVRRPTGGSAVLHEHERTYAVVGLLRTPPFEGGVIETYRSLAAVLEAALRSLGVGARAVGPAGVSAGVAAATLCFGETSHYEIASGSTKLVGSAQLRRGGAFLQHGSILLRADAARLARAAGVAEPPRGRFAGIGDVLGRPVGPEALDGAIVAAFGEVLGLDLAPGVLSAREAAQARNLAEGKYRSREWTIEGRVPRGAVDPLRSGSAD